MQYFNREHGNQASNGGLIYKYNYRYMTYTFNQLITYDRTFADRHEVNALLGHEFYSYEQNYLEASRSGLVEGIYEVVGSTINSASSLTKDHRIESYFARLNYGFDHKYYIDASWRTDGSSRFAPRHALGPLLVGRRFVAYFAGEVHAGPLVAGQPDAEGLLRRAG